MLLSVMCGIILVIKITGKKLQNIDMKKYVALTLQLQDQQKIFLCIDQHLERDQENILLKCWIEIFIKRRKTMTHKDIFKGVAYKSLEEQVGGKHYRSMKIQPAEFINENKLLFAEGNAIKYICRHSVKGKQQDIEKAIHYLKMILERDYS
jgi:hypothetical protein